LLLLAVALFCAGVDLNALLPHLGLGYNGTLAAVAALWVGAFGCFLMGISSGVVELWKR